jgi:hypothetical protein
MSKELVMMRGEPSSLGLHWATARRVRAHIQAAPKGAGTPIGGLHRRMIPFHATPPYGDGPTAGNVTQTRPTRARRSTGPGEQSRCPSIGWVGRQRTRGKRYPVEVLTPDEVKSIMAAMPSGGYSAATPGDCGPRPTGKSGAGITGPRLAARPGSTQLRAPTTCATASPPCCSPRDANRSTSPSSWAIAPPRSVGS